MKLKNKVVSIDEAKDKSFDFPIKLYHIVGIPILVCLCLFISAYMLFTIIPNINSICYYDCVSLVDGQQVINYDRYFVQYPSFIILDIGIAILTYKFLQSVCKLIWGFLKVHLTIVENKEIEKYEKNKDEKGTFISRLKDKFKKKGPEKVKEKEADVVKADLKE